MKDRRKAASAAGGKARRPAVHIDAPFLSLRTPCDIRNLNAILVSRLYDTQIDFRAANCATQLGNILRHALSLAAEEADIRDLELLAELDPPPDSDAEQAEGSDAEQAGDSDAEQAGDSDCGQAEDTNSEPEIDEPAAEPPVISLQTIAEVIDLLETTLNLLLKGEIDARIANSIGSVCNNQLRLLAMELDERKLRLEAMEEVGAEDD